MSDVPIAACLSGGLDSSSSWRLAQRRLGAPLRISRFGFSGARR